MAMVCTVCAPVASAASVSAGWAGAGWSVVQVINGKTDPLSAALAVGFTRLGSRLVPSGGLAANAGMWAWNEIAAWWRD